MAISIKSSAIAAVLAGAALVSACSPIVRRHGFVPSQTELAQFTPGVTTRAQVLEVLPAPTAGGVTGGNLYYVYSEFHTLGPLTPREVDRQVVAINIGAGDRVTGITRYGQEDGIVVPLSQRVTDDNIADLSFIRQLMGSFGRFDPSALLGGGR